MSTNRQDKSLGASDDGRPDVTGRRHRIGRPVLHRINPPSGMSYEPVREWSFGFITEYRFLTMFYMIAGTFLLFRLQEWLWPSSPEPRTLLEHIWSFGSILWLGAIIPGVMGLLGLLSFRQPQHLDAVARIPNMVVWRIVSRGTNIDALRSTINRCREEMARTPLFPYIIEVVIEEVARLDLLPQEKDVSYIVVPKKYQTVNKSLYKARGLQYALEHSTVPDDAWLVHLDEETQPTSSGIKGIARLIQEEEATGRLRVGQGAILYHRTWKEHPFLTLADNVRTGDDFARFHFQHKLGVTIFGLHGSYIVVRNDVEKSVGFDFGPVGSITEDAFWALVLMQSGVRARWCEGYLEEQSTMSLGDFVRQRRRWFQGLAKVALYAPVSIRWRLAIGTNTLLWAVAPFAALYTIGHLFYGFDVDLWKQLLANISLTSFLTLYLLGLKANLDEHPITGFFRRTGWTVLQIILLPVFSLMESIGVLSALLKPVAGFHVVKK